MPEILKPSPAWEKETGITVLDDDGWRGDGGKLKIQSFNTPISEEEFLLRTANSTCRYPADFFKNILKDYNADK